MNWEELAFLKKRAENSTSTLRVRCVPIEEVSEHIHRKETLKHHTKKIFQPRLMLKEQILDTNISIPIPKKRHPKAICWDKGKRTSPKAVRRTFVRKSLGGPIRVGT